MKTVTFVASEGTILLLRSSINDLINEVAGWNRSMASDDIPGVYDDVIEELFALRDAIDKAGVRYITDAREMSNG